MYFELVIDLLISSFTQYQLIEVSGGAFTTHFMEFFKVLSEILLHLCTDFPLRLHLSYLHNNTGRYFAIHFINNKNIIFRYGNIL